MKNTILIALLILMYSCGNKKAPLKGETEFQRNLNAQYKDATKSPLTEKARRHFKGLNFFKVDSAYVVTAKLKRTPYEKVFKMKTTTERQPEYVKYGELSFTIKEENFVLNVYQNQELKKEEGYTNYLFLPFLDETTGVESYGGGRYIDIELPEGDSIVIDFNKAYNPYCAYNEAYSCPIVPRQNYLKTRIEAGVKAYKKYK